MLRTILSAAALGGLALAASADTIHVDDDALNDPGPGDPTISDPLEDGSAKHPFDAIQKAIDASVDGDVVLVADGTYTGPGNRAIHYDGRSITVTGAAANTTIVDLQSTSSGFIFDDGEPSTARLANLQVVNGSGSTSGPALRCSNGSAPTIESCRFTNHQVTDDDGGAVALTEGSDARFEHCEFTSNLAFFGDGGAVYARNSAPVFFDCSFADNESYNEDDSALGGAVHLINAPATFTACQFSNNDAGGDFGAGGAIDAQGAPFTVEDCSFSANESFGGCTDASGGAIHAVNAEGFTVTGSDFTANRAYGSGCAGVGNGYGGAVSGSGGTFTDCTFTVNTAQAGGERIGISRGGAAQTGNVFHRCVFDRNSAERGGAIGGSGDVTVESCLFVSNVAAVQEDFDSGRGGAIDAVGGSIVNSTFIGNVAESGFGTPEGGALAASVAMVVRNCILRGNGPDQYAGAMDIEHSNVEGGAPGIGNIDVDPVFVDAANDDYRLAAGSPCIDAGSTLVALGELDLDGAPRRVDDPDTPDTGEGPAPLVDMGAYEFQPVNATCSADLDGSGAVDFGDLLQVLTNWGDCAACPSDLNGDGMVSFADLLLVLSAWGPC